MKKEKLIEAGRAAYGDNWKSSILRDLGLNHRQRITQWLNDERPIPQLEPELIAILETRKVHGDIRHLEIILGVMLLRPV